MAKEMAKTKETVIEAEGKVIDNSNGVYRVELDNGITVTAHVSGKMRMNMIRVLPGDRVTVEFSPYDLTHGRISYRR
mgnify:CR=1 FL=1